MSANIALFWHLFLVAFKSIQTWWVRVGPRPGSEGPRSDRVGMVSSARKAETLCTVGYSYGLRD